MSHFSSDKITFYLGCWAFVVFTDSTAAMSALEDFSNAHPKVPDIFNWLVLAACRGHKIYFCWVPAQVSVKENEEQMR